jgi:hypothetical protein
MKLYRQCGARELLALLRDGVVAGQWSREDEDNSYRAEYGPVVCCMPHAALLPGAWYDVTVVLDVPQEEVIGGGIWRYTVHPNCDCCPPLECEEEEVFIASYRLSQVVGYEDTIGSGDAVTVLWHGHYASLDAALLLEDGKYWLYAGEACKRLVFRDAEHAVAEMEEIFLSVPRWHEQGKNLVSELYFQAEAMRGLRYDY